MLHARTVAMYLRGLLPSDNSFASPSTSTCECASPGPLLSEAGTAKLQRRLNQELRTHHYLLRVDIFG